MIHKLNDGIFDAVLSVNLARVTRDDAETPKFMSLLRQEDILFVTDSERIYDLELQENYLFSPQSAVAKPMLQSCTLVEMFSQPEGLKAPVVLSTCTFIICIISSFAFKEKCSTKTIKTICKNAII
ncbi:hypothetical protein MOJ76_16265 [Bacillus haynesii]|nr:hypothetical protein [Bacillus haynesii]MCY8009841.1 hypothetical protein [Bacillus haynesii]MCY9278160.1 hypothetical protein [Bacillus haynesii]